jgi:predicted RNA-binding protein with PIN domain
MHLLNNGEVIVVVSEYRGFEIYHSFHSEFFSNSTNEMKRNNIQIFLDDENVTDKFFNNSENHQIEFVTYTDLKSAIDKYLDPMVDEAIKRSIDRISLLTDCCLFGSHSLMGSDRYVSKQF